MQQNYSSKRSIRMNNFFKSLLLAHLNVVVFLASKSAFQKKKYARERKFSKVKAARFSSGILRHIV